MMKVRYDLKMELAVCAIVVVAGAILVVVPSSLCVAVRWVAEEGGGGGGDVDGAECRYCCRKHCTSARWGELCYMGSRLHCFLLSCQVYTKPIVLPGSNCCLLFFLLVLLPCACWLGEVKEDMVETRRELEIAVCFATARSVDRATRM